MAPAETSDAAHRLEALRTGSKRDIARALTALDRPELSENGANLLDAAFFDPKGLVIGLTGPPGVGKSTLTQGLIGRLRASGRSVAVLAVDPSSRATGGALLGDRTRLTLDPGDQDLMVRSLAARDRLGGLSDHAIACAILMRALYDVVLVETVGIGQSDADIALIGDRTLLCIQPGSGDALQFMKAGIMEWPDILAVTKADMGQAARRAEADVEGALSLAAPREIRPVILRVSAKTGEGVDALAEAMLAPRHLNRQGQADALVRDAVVRRHGSFGLKQADIEGVLRSEKGPFCTILAVSRSLSGHA